MIPHFLFHRIWDISPSFLHEHGIRALILDVDNTLAFDGDRRLLPEVEQWLGRMREAGVRCAIVSNNKEARVRPFAEVCGLPFVAEAGKPLKKGFLRSAAVLGESASHTAVVGDQLFTDIAFARLTGCTGIMVERMGPDIPPFVRLKRILEVPFMGYIRRHRRVI